MTWAGLTWTCHICNEERPDAKISVFKHKHPGSLDGNTIEFTENVRYCNDRDRCLEGAKQFCFMGHAEDHLDEG